MSSPIPSEWTHEPPETLLVGNNSYAMSLAVLLGVKLLPVQQLHTIPDPKDCSGYALLADLQRVFFVVPDKMAAPEVLRCHQLVWKWVENLSRAKAQHDLAFIFVVSSLVHTEMANALAVGLAFSDMAPSASGHAVVSQAKSLFDLLSVAQSTSKQDLVTLRGRTAADIRRNVLAKLYAMTLSDDLAACAEVCREVLGAFAGQEYHLDLFCRPPFHEHGNRLRNWLTTAVTADVTPDWWAAGKQSLPVWLACLPSKTP